VLNGVVDGILNGQLDIFKATTSRIFSVGFSARRLAASVAMYALLLLSTGTRLTDVIDHV